MEQQVVEVPPFSFSVTRTGKGPPIVLVHGLSGSREWWRRNVEALAEKHTVYGVDLVGFGESRGEPLTSTPLAFDDIAGVLGRWLKSAFDEPVHLVGHSMGGHIAIYVTAHYPRVVRSLTLVNSTGMPFRLVPMPHLRAAAAPPPRALFSFFWVVLADFLRAGVTGVSVAAARLLADDAREAMRRIRVPTLLVWGDRDPLVPGHYAELMSQEIEPASVAYLPRAGHVAMWDNPSAFNEHLLTFLDEVEKTELHATHDPLFSWPVVDASERIAYRMSGSNPKIVLVHGLGIPSFYFRRVARAFHDAGIECIAPDLPGFGFSRTLRADPEHDADACIAWADRLGLRSMMWLGHSTGAQVVEQVATRRPDLVDRAVFLSPIWSERRYLLARTITRMPADGLMEPFTLDALAVESYWDAGVVRLLKLARYYAADAARPRQLPPKSIVGAGVDDPFAEWEIFARTGADIVRFRGAHGVHFSHPEDVVAGILATLGQRR